MGARTARPSSYEAMSQPASVAGVTAGTGNRQNPGMDGWIPSLVAVAGTLLGSATTYLFQSRAAARQQLQEREAQRREERLSAYADFVAAVTALRQAVITLWFRQRQERADGDAAPTWQAHLDSDRLGAAADHAKFRVRLVSGDAELGELAEAVFEPISALPQAPDRVAVQQLEGRSRETLTAFITAARRELDA